MDLSLRPSFEALDRADPLASFRDEFRLPPDTIYLNGNSLGPMPVAAAHASAVATEQEWANSLVKSWNTAGWFELPYRLGGLLAPVIGAGPDEVVVTDQTGVNLFKAVSLALSMRPDRGVIVMEGSNFPTNNYMVQGLIRLLGERHQIRFAEKDQILAAIDTDVAAVVLTHVHYKSAHILDMAAITRRTHEAGAVSVWDLCHSAGVLDVDLNGAGADIAVGCTYKYLNGGPGSPGFIFLAKRHHGAAQQPLTGWWGHAAPFRFDRDYAGREGIGQLLSGTQPIISMRATEAGLQLAGRADRAAVRAKAGALGDHFIALVEARCPNAGFVLASPRNAADRGGHVAFEHPDGYPIMKALIARGVIGDFRAPSTIRFGFSPLYLRYADIFDAASILAEIIETASWKQPAFQSVDAVT